MKPVRDFVAEEIALLQAFQKREQRLTLKDPFLNKPERLDHGWRERLAEYREELHPTKPSQEYRRASYRRYVLAEQ